MSREEIRKALQHTGESKIAVIGDYTLDRYLYYDPARNEPSVETGNTCYQIDHTEAYPGSAGTIVNNLCALGAQVICIGFAGDDGEGYELRKRLQAEGADISHFIKSEDMQTCVYMKPMEKQPDGSYKETNRLDIRNFFRPDARLEEQLYQSLLDVLDEVKAVIILDQYMQADMGALTSEMRQRLSDLAARRPDKLFLVDSRAFLKDYRHMMVKCNAAELARIPPVQEGEMSLAEMEEKMALLNRQNHTAFFLTRGEDGIVIADGQSIQTVPAYRVSGPLDIVGAGDATTAGIMLGLTAGLSAADAARLGCCVSSITIQQIGRTGTATIAQVLERL